MAAEYRHRSAALHARTSYRSDGVDCVRVMVRLADSSWPTQVDRSQRRSVQNRLDCWSVCRSMRADDAMSSQLSSMIVRLGDQHRHADDVDDRAPSECCSASWPMIRVVVLADCD